VKNKYWNHEDVRLLLLIQKGNREAFTVLYQRHWPHLYESAFYILKDQGSCMDVVQEVFVWFWENREKWEVSNTGAYLHAAVKYKIANQIRNGKIREAALANLQERMEQASNSVSRNVEVKELQKVIMDFTGQLPPRCQEIFRLSRFEHLSNKEIADKLDISEKTVENQITIALRRLRRHLGRLAFWMIFFL